MLVIAKEGIHDIKPARLNLQNFTLALVGSPPFSEANIVAPRALAHDLTELGLGDSRAKDTS